MDEFYTAEEEEVNYRNGFIKIHRNGLTYFYNQDHYEDSQCDECLKILIYPIGFYNNAILEHANDCLGD